MDTFCSCCRHSILRLTLTSIVIFSGQFIELEPDTGHGSRSAKTSPASLRKIVTVAEGEKAAATAVSTVTGSSSL